MSKLSIQDVEHIAKLSRLELSNIEKEKFFNQLSNILEFVDLLNEVDTINTEPTAQVIGLTNIFSSDEALESKTSYSDIGKNAPSFLDGSFKVPGVFQ